MSSPNACRRYAAECSQIASTMNGPQSRAMLLQMAQVWLRLADEKDPACNVTKVRPVRPAIRS